jgi:chitinase
MGTHLPIFRKYSNIIKSHRNIYLLFVIILGFVSIITLGGCGGSGSGSNDNNPTSSAPEISNLSLSPVSANMGSGGGQILVSHSFDFVDKNGDVSNVTLSVFNSNNRLIYTNTSPIQGISGKNSGTIQGGINADTSIAGEYTFEFYLTDTTNLKSNTLGGNFLITVDNSSNEAPYADAGTDKSVAINSTVALDGSGSSDADGDSLSYSWSIISKPEGSATSLSGSTTITPSFIADKLGVYLFSLVVNDGHVNSEADTVTVTVSNDYADFNLLQFRVIDAEYSNAMEKIIMISAGPNKLHIYDPVTHEDSTVPLPLTPTCVSVGPDGTHAAVGYDAWVSFIDLATATVEKTIAVSTSALDVVLAGNGYIYVFPRMDQWEYIRCINIDTEAETPHAGNYIYAGTKAKLHPNGETIYGANNGLSPSDIEKYSISGGTATYLYDSPYHGDYAMSGDLWISKDGLRIFTRGGNVFRSSNIQGQDMVYNGSLNNLTLVKHLDQCGISGKVAVIPDDTYLTEDEDLELQIYSYEFLSYEKSIILPCFINNGNSYLGHGSYVFIKNDGSSYYVIVKADESSGLLYDQAVVTYSNNSNGYPIADAGTDKNAALNSTVALDGSGSSDSDGDALSYVWSIVSKPEGSGSKLSGATTITPSFIPDKPGVYVFSLVVNDGHENSEADTVTVTVSSDYTDFNMLQFRVIDAEYSNAMEKIIMISAGPNKLHIYDPVTHADSTVALPLTPTCVSVGPDGTHAAVGYDAWVSYIDLSTATIEKTIAVSTNAIDVVLAGNNYIYVFPRFDQWEHIRCINLDTEEESLHSGDSVRAGTKAKLHPNGETIYGADNGLSPSDIEKYSISGGTATYLYDSPYHGDYAMSGDLWISQDGLRIFTRGGNVFRSSDIQDQDMIYNGSLSNVTLVKHLDQCGTSGKVAVIPDNSYFSEEDDDLALQIYSYQYLSYEKSITLPSFRNNGNSYRGHGSYVFIKDDGASYFVIVTADESSGLLYDQAVVTCSNN